MTIFTLDTNAPRLASVARAGTNPTNAASLQFTVTFNEAVSAVDTGDFALTATGVSGTSVSAVSGSGMTYTVTVNTGSGDGTINLDLAVSPTISDVAGNALGNTAVLGADESYTIDKTSPAVTLTVAGFTNDTTPSVTVSASDSGSGVPDGTPVRLDVDLNNDGDFADPGESSYSSSTLSAGTVTFEVSPALAEENYRLRARVSDQATNQGTSSVRTLVVDTTAPVVTLTAPDFTNDPTPSVTVSANDGGSGVPDGTPVRLDVDLNNDGDFADAGELSYSTSTLSAGTATFEVSPALDDGTYRLRARVTDQAGNDGTSDASTLVVETLPIVQSAGTTITAESFRPNNGVVDPGETVVVDLSLLNTGGRNTTNLMATLLVTGGITSPSEPQSYGVVLAGGAPVTRSFTFTVDSGVECGSMVTATLQLRDGATDLGTATFMFQVGEPGGAATYSTGDISTPIPDVSTVEIPLTVPDSGVITDVDVKIRLNHTWDADLDILLVHPDGTTVELSTDNGGGSHNYGSGPNDCSGTFTVFDDAAATSVTAGAAPFAGTFRPEGPLSTLNGKATNGTWKL